MNTTLPAHSFENDIPTLFKRGLFLLLSLIGRVGFRHSRQNSRHHRSALAAWLQEKDFEWHSSQAIIAGIAAQDTQRMPALTTQYLIDLHRGEDTDPFPSWGGLPITDKVPATFAAEHARRMHTAHLQRQVTAPMKRFQTGTLARAYHEGAKQGIPPGPRTTAAFRRISEPHMEAVTSRDTRPVSPMRQRHMRRASHAVPPGWPPSRNTLRAIRLTKDA